MNRINQLKIKNTRRPGNNLLLLHSQGKCFFSLILLLYFIQILLKLDSNASGKWIVIYQIDSIVIWKIKYTWLQDNNLLLPHSQGKWFVLVLISVLCYLNIIEIMHLENELFLIKKSNTWLQGNNLPLLHSQGKCCREHQFRCRLPPANLIYACSYWYWYWYWYW